MNIGALIALAKLIVDSGAVSPKAPTTGPKTWKEFKGRFLRAPLIHDVPYPVTMEPNLVIEFYSR